MNEDPKATTQGGISFRYLKREKRVLGRKGTCPRGGFEEAKQRENSGGCAKTAAFIGHFGTMMIPG